MYACIHYMTEHGDNALLSPTPIKPASKDPNKDNSVFSINKVFHLQAGMHLGCNTMRLQCSLDI